MINLLPSPITSDIRMSPFSPVLSHVQIQTKPDFSTKSNVMQTDKVLIEVNQFVHPVKIIPPRLKPETIENWIADSNKQEYAKIKT